MVQYGNPRQTNTYVHEQIKKPLNSLHIKALYSWDGVLVDFFGVTFIQKTLIYLIDLKFQVKAAGFQ